MTTSRGIESLLVGAYGVILTYVVLGTPGKPEGALEASTGLLVLQLSANAGLVALFLLAVRMIMDVRAREERGIVSRRTMNKWTWALLIAWPFAAVAYYCVVVRSDSDSQSAPPNKSLQPTRAAEPNGQRESPGSGPRG